MENIELKVDSDVENRLVKRREISASATYSGKTPSREEVKQELCKMLNLKPEASAIVRISQAYGSMSSTVTLHSYPSKAEMEKLERTGKKKAVPKPAAAEKKEEPKAAEAAAPAAKEAVGAPKEAKEEKK